jgi:hypothetical protein
MQICDIGVSPLLYAIEYWPELTAHISKRVLHPGRNLRKYFTPYEAFGFELLKL